MAGLMRDLPAAVFPESLVVDDGIPGSGRRLVYLPAPPPPPPGPVTSLVLTTPDTVLLHGQTLDARRLVVRGLDATGRWVKAPPVVVAAPGGWTVADGLVTAPGVDGVGEVTLRSGGAEATVRVHVVPDLRTRRWRLQWACAGPVLDDMGATVGDSAAFDLEVDSTRYAWEEDPGLEFPFTYGGVIIPRVAWATAVLYTRGTRTRLVAGSAITDSVRYTIPLLRQWPDSVVLKGPGYASQMSGRPVTLPRLPGQARAYAAEAPVGGMCHDLSYTRGGMARFEETL
jgi:hypothetical protein